MAVGLLLCTKRAELSMSAITVLFCIVLIYWHGPAGFNYIHARWSEAALVGLDVIITLLDFICLLQILSMGT